MHFEIYVTFQTHTLILGYKMHEYVKQRKIQAVHVCILHKTPNFYNINIFLYYLQLQVLTSLLQNKLFYGEYTCLKSVKLFTIEDLTYLLQNKMFCLKIGTFSVLKTV